MSGKGKGEYKNAFMVALSMHCTKNQAILFSPGQAMMDVSLGKMKQ